VSVILLLEENKNKEFHIFKENLKIIKNIVLELNSIQMAIHIKK
jgi:hypothetical protein